MNRIQNRITAGGSDSEAVADTREHSHPLTEAADLDQLVADISEVIGRIATT